MDYNTDTLNLLLPLGSSSSSACLVGSSRGVGVSEMSQRGTSSSSSSTRTGLQLKTGNNNADSDGNPSPGIRPHNVEKSPRLGKSPRSISAERKRGARIPELEAQLSQAQAEVKKLKEKLASAENAKKEANQELEKTKKLIIPTLGTSADEIITESQNKLPESNEPEAPETPPEKEQVKSVNLEIDTSPDACDSMGTLDIDGLECTEKEHADIEAKEEVSEELTAEKQCTEAAESSDVTEVEGKLLMTVQEIMKVVEENEILKSSVAENEDLKMKIENLTNQLQSLTEEFGECKKKNGKITDQLEVVMQAKAEMEAELRRVKVQTEQWRKAAEAAAAVLASTDNGGMGFDSNSCSGSANGRPFGFDRSSEYAGLDSPMSDIMVDGTYGSKRRSNSGIRKFGELWKKKSPK